MLTLGLAAIPVYRFSTAPTIETDAQNPLGRFADIETFLIERDYVKSERELTFRDYDEERYEQLEGARMWKFEKRPGSGSMSMRQPWAAVIVDNTGKVRGVTASFFSRSKELGRATAGAEMVVRDLWSANASSEPSFREALTNEGKYSTPMLLALFTGNGIKGKWEKTYGESGNPHTIDDRVTIYTD